MSKSKDKIPTKKQLLVLLKKHNYVKQHVADGQGVHEKTVRRFAGRDFRLTDVAGRVHSRILS